MKHCLMEELIHRHDSLLDSATDFVGWKWQPSRSSVKSCKQIGRNIPTQKSHQCQVLYNVWQAFFFHIAYFAVERRKKGGRAKSIKVIVSTIRSVLQWNQPNNTHSLPTAELASPLFSLMKWLLKWKEILMGWFSLGAFWKGKRATALTTSPR